MVRRLFGLVLSLGASLQAGSVLLLVPARRFGVATRRMVSTAPLALLALSAVRSAVLGALTPPMPVVAPPLALVALPSLTLLLMLVTLLLNTLPLHLMSVALLLIVLVLSGVALSRLSPRPLA